MTTIRPIFGPARFRVSRISFRCDVTNASGREIPLGILSDFRASGLYGLGLMARKRLNEDEILGIGSLVRSAFSEPFDVLMREFDEILRADDSIKEFTAMTMRHRSSLVFRMLPESSFNIPKHLIMNEDESRDAFSDWSKFKFEAAMADEYWEFVSGQQKNRVQIRDAA